MSTKTQLGRSIFSCLEQSVLKTPHTPAVICMDQKRDHFAELLEPGEIRSLACESGAAVPENDCLSVSYAQLLAIAQRLVAGFLSRGLKPESTVLICVPNGGEFCALYWACILMNLTVVCISPIMAQNQGDEYIQEALRKLNPSLVVVADIHAKVFVQRAIDQLARTHPVGLVMHGNVQEQGWFTFFDLARIAICSSTAQTMLDEARCDNPRRVHSILFTSGTSGKPKGCPLEVAGQIHFLDSWHWLMNEQNTQRALQQAHNSRAIAPTQMLQTWSSGGTILLPSRDFYVEDTFKAIQDFGATFVAVSPAMVYEIEEMAKSQSTLDTSSVRTVQVGGDAVSKAVLLKCATLFPQAQICCHHGMSEGVAAFKWPFFEKEVSEIPFLGEICPIGELAPDMKIKLWRSDLQRLAGADEPGELHVCGPGIIKQYLGDESASSFYDDSEGHWFVTGDMAAMSPDGLVYILGRCGDIMKRAGTAVIPKLLEGVIQQFVGAQVCVVGVPDTMVGEAIYVVLDGSSGRSGQEIQRHVRSRLGKQGALDAILTLSGVGMEKFPVNETFKIVRSEVRKAVIQHVRNIRS